MASPKGSPSDNSFLNKQKPFDSSMREQAVFHNRTKLLFDNIPATIIATFIVAPCLMFVNWDIIDHSIMITWFIYMSATMAFRFTIYILFRRKKTQDFEPRLWVKLFALGTALTAIGWGVTGSTFILSDSLQQQMFTTIMLAGLSAGALATLTSFYTVFALFTLINMLPLVYSMINFATPFHYTTSALISIFLVFILGASTRMAKTIRDSISLQFQHDDALKDLAAKNQQADDLNLSLRQQINEREIIEQHLENSMSQLNATFESATDGI
ncbi:MAG: hypothetical protein KAU21_17125, partial [Gammaproteobacteria bacterium]|nr:hypothetical protein [Gammaproteobacteria bacterium]